MSGFTDFITNRNEERRSILSKFFEGRINGETSKPDSVTSISVQEELLDIVDELKEKGFQLPNFDLPLKKQRPEVIPYCPVDPKTDIRDKFNKNVVQTSLRRDLKQLIPLEPGKTIDRNFEPIRSNPLIDIPMHHPLKELSLEYILPGIGDVENNIVFLAEENRRFIEAYMIGLNHEFNKELLWREYPTDQRGTIFRYFWDFGSMELNPTTNKLQPRTDIDEIIFWNKKLGLNKTDILTDDQERQRPDIVLVIKADLIERYPDVLIYAVLNDELIDPSNPDAFIENRKIILPKFKANLGNNVLLVGFPITISQILDGSYEYTQDGISNNLTDKEFYVVLQENQHLPVFGLDADGQGDTQVDDMNWQHFPAGDNGYIQDMNNYRLQGVNNIVNSASIAANTYQLPVRLFYHFKTFLIYEEPEDISQEQQTIESILKDTSAPILEIISPIGGQIVSGRLTIEVLVKDASIIDRVLYRIGGDEFAPLDTLDGVYYYKEIEIPHVMTGPQTITIFATDEYDNSTNEYYIEIDVH